jgi:prepilin-type processing-associated H-X9-DG protein
MAFLGVKFLSAILEKWQALSWLDNEKPKLIAILCNYLFVDGAVKKIYAFEPRHSYLEAGRFIYNLRRRNTEVSRDVTDNLLWGVFQSVVT